MRGSRSWAQSSAFYATASTPPHDGIPSLSIRAWPRRGCNRSTASHTRADCASAMAMQTGQAATEVKSMPSLSLAFEPKHLCLSWENVIGAALNFQALQIAKRSVCLGVAHHAAFDGEWSNFRGAHPDKLRCFRH